MKTTKFLSLASIALIGLALPALAGPRGGGGGSGGGGRPGGGHSGSGGIRAAPPFSGGGARFGGANPGGFRSGGLRAAPPPRSSSYFTGRGISAVNRAPRLYYNRGGMSSVRSHAFTASRNGSITSNARRTSTISGRQNRAALLTRQNRQVANSQVTAKDRQPNRIGSNTRRNRVSDQRTSTAAKRQSFVKNHASERHDGNWHRDWDKHRAHFHHNRVFVFVDGFWWGLYPWDYYPYYAYGYPYDYSYGNSYDYYGYYNYYPYDYDDQPAYATSEYGNNSTVSAVQSELARLGYYNGAIDGVLGDQTEAAISRYQEDQDLSVSGTVDAATLESLGIK
jgi:hypothetical protein